MPAEEETIMWGSDIEQREFGDIWRLWHGEGMVGAFSVHCSPIRNRPAEVMRDQAAAELGAQQRSDAERRVSEMSAGILKPWSEPSRYWKSLAQHGD